MGSKQAKTVRVTQRIGTTHETLMQTQSRSGFFAAERIVFIHRPDIHTSHVWHVTEDGMVMADSHIVDSIAVQPSMSLVALKSDLSPATSGDNQHIITSAIEVAKHIEGPVAGRIVMILYRMANDPPNWRTARFSVDIATVLTSLQTCHQQNRY